LQFLSKKEVPFKEIIPQGYVDIHSHLLPGIDDGVHTIYQSAYIIEQFEKLGIKKMITTPHVMQDVWPNTSEILRSKLNEVRTALPVLDIDVVIETSAEYMLDDLFYKRITEKDIIPLHQKYVLVEMSTFSAPLNINEILFEIKLAGYIPILAHPERYTFYMDNIEKLITLKQSGFLFQLNLLSISGYYGEQVKNMALKILAENLYDFVGSDVHNYHQFEILEKGFSTKQADTISKLMEKNCIFN